MQHLESGEADLTIQHEVPFKEIEEKVFPRKPRAKSSCTTKCFLNVQFILISLVKSSCFVIRCQKNIQFKDGLLKEDAPGM